MTYSTYVGCKSDKIIYSNNFIFRGEELTISYMSPLQRSDFHTRESRRNILQNEFGFYCQCNLCSEPNDLDLKQNDLDRRNLLDIEQKWIHLGQDPFKVII